MKTSFLMVRWGFIVGFIYLGFCLCTEQPSVTVPQLSSNASESDFLVYDIKTLRCFKDHYQAGKPDVAAVIDDFIRKADALLSQKTYTVVDKQQTPPSGDKQDYMSLSIYWWPNPITGIPYIHRDGQRNPEADNYDGKKIWQMSVAVQTQALAYYFTDDEMYASKATAFLRTWFIAENTRMNPHMKYAQGIPGITHGTRQGIIETVPLATKVIDSVRLIQDSSAWSARDHQALQGWFRDYLDWLLTSRLGGKERVRKNNHGTWYDVQVVSFASFIGDNARVQKTLTESVPQRIVQQIQPDGRMPRELSRTKSFDYSCYNLKALFILTQMGKQRGIDLWQFQGPQGQSIPTALHFLCQYADEEKQWPYKQIKPVNRKATVNKYAFIAATLFDDSTCYETLTVSPEVSQKLNWLLFY